MNRYPLWVYVTVAVAFVIGLVYTLPNFFGEAPAVQITGAKATVHVDTDTLGRAEAALRRAKVEYTGAQLDLNSVRIRFASTDTQLKAPYDKH